MKRVFTSLALVFVMVMAAQAQYYYKSHTYLARHTDHPGHNPGMLNNDLEATYNVSQPNGWAQMDNGAATSPRWTAVYSIPFSFSFNGSPVTHFKVSTTGVLTFDTATALSAPVAANVAIPSALIPNSSIMIWGINGSAANDKILYKTFGTAPNQQHWIMFSSYSYPSPQASTCYGFWSIVLEETTNKIYIVDMRNSTTSACNPSLTIGIQVNGSTAYSVNNAPNTQDYAGKTQLTADNVYYEWNQGTRPAADIKMYQMTVTNFKVPPTTTGLTGRIINYGSSPVTSVDFKYDIGGTVYTRNITGLNIATNATGLVSHNIPINIAAAGRIPIRAWVEVAGDADQSNDSMSSATHGLSFTPDKRVLFEEATGTWCGWCPRGTVYMDSLRSVYPSTATLIAVHNGDPMATGAAATYDTWMGYEIGGYPSGLVDRKSLDVDPSSFFSSYNSLIQDKAPCDIDVQTTYDPTTRQMQAIVHAHFATNMEGDYRFNAVVVEDDVTGTSSGYAQVNYYNGYAPALIGAGHNWYTEPDPIPAANMEYDHVARTLLGPWDGVVGSLPSSIADGSDHYWTFNYTVPAAQDPSTIHVVGWVNEPVTGNVYNSARSVGAIVGMPKPASENFDVRIYPNPSAFATNIKVDLKKSAKVSVEVYDITGRTVYSSIGKTLASGEFIYPLQVSQLADGLYSVKITVDNEQITKRLVVQQ